MAEHLNTLQRRGPGSQSLGGFSSVKSGGFSFQDESGGLSPKDGQYPKSWSSSPGGSSKHSSKSAKLLRWSAPLPEGGESPRTWKLFKPPSIKGSRAPQDSQFHQTAKSGGGGGGKRQGAKSSSSSSSCRRTPKTQNRRFSSCCRVQ